MKHSFSPIINEASQILILGTMPGELSLKLNAYYANPRNQFWRIMEELYHIPVVMSYSERTALLLEQRLALWDVLGSAERIGALDKAIKNPIANYFAPLFEAYPNLRALVFNGKKAHTWFEQLVVKKKGLKGFEKIQKIVVPSTSPAATIELAEKIRRWRTIVEL